MTSKRFFFHTRSILLLGLIALAGMPRAEAQEQEERRGISNSWLLLQAVPSLSWTGLPAGTHFSFEWELTPVLYSWGMTRLDPPVHFFFVTQPERFAGSVEFNITTQWYTSRIGTSHWGFSGQLMAHLPLVEYGEYLGLNLGVARYTIAGSSSNFIAGGFSTLFGFLHYTVKYSPADKMVMHSIDFRFF
ncbi:MAG: hypothetical protein EHM64_06985 [Ignavibacteriae bacterium]|nr:MAG: hypothetical protein EHM64_06985 [Ignavibacteriota bacterium]